jgi:putative membrane protein
MMGIEWLKPGVFFGSILYALIGVAVFWISFIVVDKLTPYSLWEEIVEKKNVALAIVVGAMCIAIGQIVAAAIQG